MTAADSCQQPFRLILEAGDFSLSPGPVVRGGHGRNLLCPGARTRDQFGKTGHKFQKLFRKLAPVSCFGSAMATSMGSIHADSRRSEEHTSELQSLMRISYAVFCLKKKNIYTLTLHIS